MAPLNFVSTSPVVPGGSRLAQFVAPNGHPARAYRDAAGIVWFLAVDLWRCLDLKPQQPARYKSRIKDPGQLSKPLVWVVNGMRKLQAINEDGMHRMLGVSRKENCAELRAWMTLVVVPSLGGAAVGVPR